MVIQSFELKPLQAANTSTLTQSNESALQVLSTAGSASLMSSGESPAFPRKRQRLGAFSDDEMDQSLDVPLNMRHAARIIRPEIQGLEEDEEDDGDDLKVEVKEEPTMRKRIEKHQSCKAVRALLIAWAGVL